VTIKLSQEEFEQQISNETAEMESAAEWPINATKRYEDGMGDLVDLPICREEVQWRRLHTKGQPWEQLNEVIEEIKRLMIISAEAVNKGKLNTGEPTIATGQQQQQQQQSRGADG
jgi:hypothetical protein